MKVIVPDLTSDLTSVEGLLGAELCAEHMAEQLAIPLERNPAIEAFLSASADPATEPDFDHAYLDAIPVGSMEYRAFRGMLEPRPN